MSSPNAQLTKLALGIAGVAAVAAITGRFSMSMGAAVEAAPELLPSTAGGERVEFLDWGDDEEEEGEEYEPVFAKPQTQPSHATTLAPTQRTRSRRS